MVVNPGTVCEVKCNDCPRRRIIVTEVEPGLLDGESLIRVTVMAGCGRCEGSTTIV